MVFLILLIQNINNKYLYKMNKNWITQKIILS